MQFEMPRLGGAAANVIQLESEPAGAEAKTSTGQACRTPCSLSVPANEFTVTFSQPGFQPQTLPVRVAASDAVDPASGEMQAPRLVPNPVYAELQPAAPAPTARRRATQPRKPRPAAAAPRPTAAAPMAPAPTAPAPAPAAAWPPPGR
jgi:hypothetical protein